MVLAQAAERFPGHSAPHLELAILAEEAGAWAEAEQAWRGFLKVDPLSPRGQFGLARAVAEQGRRDDAEAALRDAMHRLPNEPAVWVNFARLAEKAGEQDAAIGRWNDVVARFPTQWEGYAGLANLHRRLGAFDRAAEVLARAAAALPDLVHPLQDLARLAEARRDWAEAARWWRAYCERDEQKWWAHAALARAQSELGARQEAEATLRRALDRDPACVDLLIEHARLAERWQQWHEAQGRWQTAAAVAPDRWEVYAGQFRAAHELGDAAAGQLLHAGLRRLPNSAELWGEVARIAESRQDWAEAERAWRSAAAKRPDAWWAHDGLARVLQELGRHDEAETTLSGIAAAFPSEPIIAVAYARVAERRADWGEALVRWNRVAEYIPESPTGPLGAAGALRRLGKPSEALGVLQAAAARFPSSGDIRRECAELSIALGDVAAAERHLREAIEAEPTNVGCYTHLATFLRDRSRLSEAASVLGTAQARLPDHPRVLYELAALAERQAAWTEAVEGYRACLRVVPHQVEALVGLARALVGDGKYDEGEQVLNDALARHPGNKALAVELAHLPYRAGSEGLEEFLRRARLLVEADPNQFEYCTCLWTALLVNHLPGECETFLEACVERFGRRGVLLHQLAEARTRQAKWEAAIPVFAELVERDEPAVNIFIGYSAALTGCRRFSDARAVIGRAAQRNPSDLRLDVALLDVLLSEESFAEAADLWRALHAKSEGQASIRRELFSRRGHLLDQGIDPMEAPASTVVPSDHAEMPVEQLVLHFESLGGSGIGCEFGLLQRFHGAEPISLLRWTEMEPEPLIAALEARLDGVGTPEQTLLYVPDHGEYIVSDRLFGMRMHTFVRTDQVAAEKMRVQLLRRLAYLREKLLEDLRNGEKIFVYKNRNRTVTDDELQRLHAAIRSYGDNTTLLYVRIADEFHPFPTVVNPKPGLLVGYIDRFAQSNDSLPVASWGAILKQAHAMWSRTRPIP
jgi:tetratricopeptide (TPR) repeat protein